MVATYPFNPGPSTPFSFQPTLDGSTYLVTVKWNIVGQRWYVECDALDGTLVFNLPMIGSPLGYDVNLAAGYFATSTLVFREPSNAFEVGP